MDDYSKFLRTVAPEILKEPLWLRRNDTGDVVIDLLKGDLSNQFFFVRSQIKMLIQAFVFTAGWSIVVLFVAEAVKSLLSELTVFEWPVSSASFDRASVGTFLIATSAIYWNFSKKYGDQWTYCAGVFNKIFYDKFPASNPVEHLFRKATFAIDLIDCSLWHHKSFRMDFNYILECSVIYQTKDPTLANKMLQRFSSGEMRIQDARDSISHFQNELEKRLQWESVLGPNKSESSGASYTKETMPIVSPGKPNLEDVG